MGCLSRKRGAGGLVAGLVFLTLLLGHARPARSEADLGLTLELELASAYVFRGLNVFQRSSQADQHALVAPSITWDIFDTGLSLTWWSAYQALGEGRGALVAEGVGHEQDFVLAWGGAVVPDLLSVEAALTAYVYPFADADRAGCAVPSYLEPSVGLVWTPGVDVSLTLAYLAGLQDALSDYRYLYTHLALSKDFELSAHVGLQLSLGFGAKLYNDPSRMTDNVFDLAFAWGLPLQLAPGLSLTPTLHIAWTDLDGRELGDEYVIWASTQLAYEM